MKIYIGGDKKYGGAEYDILDNKLQIFYDCCTKVGLVEDQFHLAFSIMLIGKASEFYYDKIAGRLYNFIQMVEMTRLHFETEERRQKYLSEWRETTLLRTILKNPGKSRLECLEIVLDKLRTTQRGLSTGYQFEHRLRDQALNACRGVTGCSLALFKPAATFEGLCADLRAAINTTIQIEENSTHDQHLTDRTYEGHRGPAQGYQHTPRPARTTQNDRSTMICHVCKKQ